MSVRRRIPTFVLVAFLYLLASSLPAEPEAEVEVEEGDSNEDEAVDSSHSQSAILRRAQGLILSGDYGDWNDEPILIDGESTKNDNLDEEMEEEDFIKPYIVGGDQVDSNRDFAFFVQALGCGATLIANDIILSAAHCSDKIQDGTKVLVGAYRDWEEVSNAEFHYVDKTILHPDYNDNEENDFLVAKLTKPVSNPTLVTLNRDSDFPIRDSLLIVIGFGRTDEDYRPGILQKVELRLVDDYECRDAFLSGWVDTPTMFCALGSNKDACHGDSGGPILNEDNVQMGAISWGVGCADGRYPGVYSRVSSAIDWIEGIACSWSEEKPDYCPF